MGLRGTFRDLAKSESEQESDDIRAERVVLGASSDEGLHDRELAGICGVIRSVTLPAKTSCPLLEAEVYDGVHTVRLVWIGRRSIPGIEPGTFVRAQGRVCMQGPRPTIHNPFYEIVAKR